MEMIGAEAGQNRRRKRKQQMLSIFNIIRSSSARRQQPHFSSGKAMNPKAELPKIYFTPKPESPPERSLRRGAKTRPPGYQFHLAPNSIVPSPLHLHLHLLLLLGLLAALASGPKLANCLQTTAEQQQQQQQTRQHSTGE